MTYEPQPEPESLLKPFYKIYKNRTYTSEDLKNLSKLSNPIHLKVNRDSLLNRESFNESITAYEIGENSGFFYIPNPFNGASLLRLIVDSIIDWPNCTNRMNLDIEEHRPDDIWTETMNEIKANKKLTETWLYKLRWTSMGYHYQWTDRIYKRECRSAIPDRLSTVMKDIISVLGWKEFFPEAAIVNYYHLNSAMCFHQDHAEFARDVPLVSLSLGQSAVYLLGTKDPSSTPIPLVLNHGDVVVMSGPSRLAYHAVPKIVKVDEGKLADRMLATDSRGVCEYLRQLTDSNEFAELIWQYLQVSRININMRQVVETNQTFPG